MVKGMGQALVSIVIPVYNAEAYIEECLNSIVKQNYQNIELVIIDDGSTDASFDLCQNYAETDSRIHVVQKKKEGVSKARNIGIQRSRGKYLLFVDADDYIKKSYVEKLVQNIGENDIAICGYLRVREEAKSILYRESGLLSKKELFTHSFCSNLIGGSCWNKLLKADIVKQNKLCFDESISIGEDMLFLAEYYQKCKKVFYVSEALYYYRCNPQSALQQSYQKKQFDSHSISCLEAAEKLGRLYENDTEDIVESIAYRKVRSCLWLLYQMVFCKYYDRHVLRRMQRIIRSSYGKYRKNRYGTYLEKLTAIGVCIFPTLVYWIGTVMTSCFRRKAENYLT